MAVLSDADRALLHQQVMSELSSQREGCLSVKVDVRATVNAMDDWVVANAATFNLAIPLPARTQLTASQKARLFSAVVLRRFVTGA